MLVDLDFYLVCASAFLIIGYIFYYLTEVVKKPLLAVSNGPFKQFLLENVPTIDLKYWPTIWCVESRVQTIFASYYRTLFLSKINYRREIFILKDGGEIALDWMEADCKPDSPLIFILPGITGASQENYIRFLVLAAKSIGFRTIVFNNRGLGGLKLKTPRLYCAANIDDVAEVIAHVKKLNPTVPLGGVGISMGGLLLGHFLADNSELAKNTFTACCIYSAPFNVSKGSDSISRPVLNKMISKYLADALSSIVEEGALFKDSNELDINKIRQSKTLKEFDSSFTTIHFGFDDVEHYYRSASLHEKLDKISVPLLCLNAADDPFQPIEAIPIENAQKSTHVAIAVTTRGGHIGFLDGFLPNSKDQYMARIFTQYFKSSLLPNDQFNEMSAEMLRLYKMNLIS